MAWSIYNSPTYGKTLREAPLDLFVRVIPEENTLQGAILNKVTSRSFLIWFEDYFLILKIMLGIPEDRDLNP